MIYFALHEPAYGQEKHRAVENHPRMVLKTFTDESRHAEINDGWKQIITIHAKLKFFIFFKLIFCNNFLNTVYVFKETFFAQNCRGKQVQKFETGFKFEIFTGFTVIRRFYDFLKFCRIFKSKRLKWLSEPKIKFMIKRWNMLITTFLKKNTQKNTNNFLNIIRIV